MSALLSDLAHDWLATMARLVPQLAVLVVVMLTIDLLTRRWLWPQIRFALWLAIGVRLILPPGLKSSWSLAAPAYEWSEQLIQLNGIESTSAISLAEADRIPAEPGPTAASPASLALVLFFLWMSGALLVGAVSVGGAMRCRRRLRETRCIGPANDDLLRTVSSVTKRLGMRRVPAVWTCSAARQALAFGVLDPVVVLPRDWATRWQGNSLEHVLLHECAHHRRRDTWLSTVLVALRCIYWFHPGVWILERRLLGLIEICCDSTVSATLRDTRREYRRTLLLSSLGLQGPASSAARILPFSLRGDGILDRLRWLEKGVPLRGAIANASILVVLMTTSLMTMPHRETPHGRDERVVSRVEEQPVEPEVSGLSPTESQEAEAIVKQALEGRRAGCHELQFALLHLMAKNSKNHPKEN